jgi:hypothetical protein
MMLTGNVQSLNASAQWSDAQLSIDGSNEYSWLPKKSATASTGLLFLNAQLMT